MYRIFTRPKGAPINDPRVGQPMWSKPGTPLDRVAKAQRTEQLHAAYAKYGIPHGMRTPTGNREQARRKRAAERVEANRLDRGYVLAAGLRFLFSRRGGLVNA